MIRFRSSLLIGSVIALAVSIAPAHAQQSRSFVSGVGNDGNAPNCTRTAPCRTFQVAHNNTIANGEITVLDPGSYGSVTITKNISIINDGVGEAGLLVSGGATGITINAGANDAVTLRGLTIKGIGFGGGNGIHFSAGKALTVENCTVRNLDGDTTGTALLFDAASGALALTNTTITDNSNFGINITPLPSPTASVTAVLDHVGLYNTGFNGLFVEGAGALGGTINLTVVDTVAINNNSAIVVQSDLGKAIVTLSLIRSVVNSGQFGVGSFGHNSAAVVGASIIQMNGSGWQALGGGEIFSYGDNEVSLNTSNQGPMPLASKQ